MYPDELKYNIEHTWLKLEGADLGRVGITQYAQEQLKEVVFIELPEVGTEVEQLLELGSTASSLDRYPSRPSIPTTRGSCATPRSERDAMRST